MGAQKKVCRFVVDLARDSEEGEQFVATQDGEGIGVEVDNLRSGCED